MCVGWRNHGPQICGPRSVSQACMRDSAEITTNGDNHVTRRGAPVVPDSWEWTTCVGGRMQQFTVFCSARAVGWAQI